MTATPGIEILDRRGVLALATSRGGSVVTGVTVEGLDTPSRPEDLDADLVIDASGRSSPTPKWLEELGFAAPPQERVQVGLMYSTRLYRRRPGDLGEDLIVLVGPTASSHRVGVLCADLQFPEVEGRRR